MMAENTSDDTKRTRLWDYIPSASDFLSPESLSEGIVISIEVPETIVRDQTVTFEFQFRNRFPFTVDLPTEQRPWTWAVDNVPDADIMEPKHDPTAERVFSVGAGETQTIEQYWSGRVRTDPNKGFKPPEVGTHTVSVWINTPVEDPPSATAEFEILRKV